jgi:hypothetical protein
MEASVAAAGAAEGAPAGAVEGTESTPGGLDLGPVLERFDGLGSRLEQMETRLAESLGGGEEEGDEGGFEFDVDSLFGDPGEQEPSQGQLNPQALQNLIQQATQSQLQEALGPLLQRVQGMEVGLDAERLAAQYPDLAKAEIAGPVVEQAKELAAALGRPELAHNTQVIELIYKAQMADQYAAGERPVGTEQGFELERASGSGPAAADEPNTAERIIAQRQKSQFWNAW